MTASMRAIVRRTCGLSLSQTGPVIVSKQWPSSPVPARDCWTSARVMAIFFSPFCRAGSS
jgi:hypothetical protein